jgi:hypothetical protein
MLQCGLIEELVKAPKYDSSTRSNQKFTEELSQEVERLLQINDEKHSRGLHKQVMKKIDQNRCNGLIVFGCNLIFSSQK